MTAVGTMSAAQYSPDLSDAQARYNASVPRGFVSSGAYTQQGPSANGLSARDAERRAPGSAQFIRPSTGVSDATAQQKWIQIARAQESGQPV